MLKNYLHSLTTILGITIVVFLLSISVRQILAVDTSTTKISLGFNQESATNSNLLSATSDVYALIDESLIANTDINEVILYVVPENGVYVTYNMNKSDNPLKYVVSLDTTIFEDNYYKIYAIAKIGDIDYKSDVQNIAFDNTELNFINLSNYNTIKGHFLLESTSIGLNQIVTLEIMDLYENVVDTMDLFFNSDSNTNSYTILTEYYDNGSFYFKISGYSTFDKYHENTILVNINNSEITSHNLTITSEDIIGGVVESSNITVNLNIAPTLNPNHIDVKFLDNNGITKDTIVYDKNISDSTILNPSDGNFILENYNINHLDNGAYTIQAYAEFDNESINSNILIFQLSNTSTEVTDVNNSEETSSTNTEETISNTNTTNDSEITQTTAEEEPQIIQRNLTFINSSNYIEGNADFFIETDFQIQELKFVLKNRQTQETTQGNGTIVSTYSGKYSFVADSFPEGQYTIYALVTPVDSTIALQKDFNFEYALPVIEAPIVEEPVDVTPITTPDPEPETNTKITNSYVPETENTPKEIQTPIEEKNETITPQTTPQTTAKDVSYVEKRELCVKFDITNKYKCDRLMNMPAVCQEKGITSVSECEMLEYLPQTCIDAGILDRNECSSLMEKLSLPTICKEANIESQEECFNYQIAKSLPSECVEKNIYNIGDCESLLNEQSKIEELDEKCIKNNILDEKDCQAFILGIKLDPICIENGIIDLNECDAFLLTKYKKEICSEINVLSSSPACESYIKNKFINQATCDTDNWNCLLMIQNNIGQIAKKEYTYKKLLDISMSENNHTDTLSLKNALEENKDVVSLTSNEIEISFIQAKPEFKIEDDIEKTSPVIIIIDSDQDGLNDDLEKIIGTNINLKDTDQDGYDDFTEYKSGYNPLGAGKMNDSSKVNIMTVLADKKIEHPKTNGDISSNIIFNNPKNSDQEGIVLSGKANPNQDYLLYIYSDLPILTTVETDEYGNWKYNFKESIVDGRHEIYLTVNDNTGKILEKSSILELFIKEAKAVSAEDFVNTALLDDKDESDSMIMIYILTALFATFGAILIFIAYFKFLKNTNNTNNEV